MNDAPPTAARDEQVRSLERTIELLHQETDDLRSEAARARRRADRLRVELDVILASRLWQLCERIRSMTPRRSR